MGVSGRNSPVFKAEKPSDFSDFRVFQHPASGIVCSRTGTPFAAQAISCLAGGASASRGQSDDGCHAPVAIWRHGTRPFYNPANLRFCRMSLLRSKASGFLSNPENANPASIGPMIVPFAVANSMNMPTRRLVIRSRT
jgi:hypothetical protein